MTATATATGSAMPTTLNPLNVNQVHASASEACGGPFDAAASFKQSSELSSSVCAQGKQGLLDTTATATSQT